MIETVIVDQHGQPAAQGLMWSGAMRPAATWVTARPGGEYVLVVMIDMATPMAMVPPMLQTALS